MSDDIHKFLHNLADGDMDALGELYDLLSARILNYAKMIVRTESIAEDITHDVFLQIHMHAARIAKTKNPEGYIMVIVRHRAYNQLKRDKRTTASLDSLQKSDITDSSGDTLEFDDAFSRLPPNQRETVYLHLICGYTHKEASAILGVPLATIKWRYGRALSRLRNYFES